MKTLEQLFCKYKAIKKKQSEEIDIAEKSVVEFVSYIRKFYEIYDMHESTNHSEILELLFFNKRKLSGEYIAQKMYISPKTLYRFKTQYLAFISNAIKSDVFGIKIGQILTEIL